ncbi:LppM family (lipo)protein [Jiangella asiatica]|uniref:LppM domain-containing protein n=1 Tax=Jiangella asiatica TaxID=2530372 RepID=A0A4R5DI18_9ACTN|nr:hypothetical protein [Jiangella asiatica]TDE10143.1 hypothetical protein E1269_12570 [Jiangella asiatica]
MRRATSVRALVAAVAAMALTGCMKMDIELDVSSDDTVDGTMVLALSRDAAAMAESVGEDPDALFESFGTEGLPEGAEAEEYEDDDFVGQQYTFDDVALSEFDESESGLGITHEGEEIIVSGNLDMSQLDPGSMTSGDLEGLQDQLGPEAEQFGDLEGLMDSFEMNVSITFPGEVLDHNGELDGTTVSWTPVPGENLEINARSADSGGGGGDGLPLWLWILVIVVVVGLIALLFFLSRNRNQAPSGEAAATPAATTAGVVPPPPPAQRPADTEPPADGEAGPARDDEPPAPPR